MLRRLAPTDVRLGMFVEDFDGSWLDHPFWRKGFVLKDPKDLNKVHQSKVRGVIIDDARGQQKAAPPPPPVAAAAPAPVAAPASHSPSAPRAAKVIDETPCSAAEELVRARAIVDKSKRAVTRMFGEARMGRAVKADSVMPLVDEIAGSIARNPSALISVARLKTVDEYTYMHSVAVSALMINLGRQLDMEGDALRQLGLAGMLHDVGKMAMPEEVLNKQGKLTDEEFAIIRDHPARGHALMIGGKSTPAVALDVCLHHHEKMDGSGYPERLRGDAISVEARMGAICDVYDALTSDRAYKQAWSPADTMARMLEWRGHFDPDILATFVAGMGIYPLGMLVRLSSGRLAVITDSNPDDLTHPRVRAFYCIADRRSIDPLDLTVSTEGGVGERIVQREYPDAWGFGDWEEFCAKLLAG